MRRLSVALIGAVSTIALTQIASAADLPVKAPQVAATYESGYYIRIDGSYQSVRLPNYDLGLRVLAGQAALDSFDPRANGYGISGAIGYILPHGIFFGANSRVEIGGSFVKATDSQTSNGSTNADIGVQFVGGTSGDFFFCPCITATTLSTDYQAWQANAKAASDIRYGATTVTPSLAVFGGVSHNDQSFVQTLTTFGNLTAIYSVNSGLSWTDFGMKAGLDGRFNFNEWIALGLGGSVGVAYRHTSLSANDVMRDILAPNFSGATAISTTATNSPFLANAEASLIFKPSSQMTWRAFVGLNYDSAVPAIAPAISTSPTIGSTSAPASIRYESTTSYYVGGGLTMKFATR